jgi:hypothetical protein
MIPAYLPISRSSYRRQITVQGIFCESMIFGASGFGAELTLPRVCMWVIAMLLSWFEKDRLVCLFLG